MEEKFSVKQFEETDMPLLISNRFFSRSRKETIAHIDEIKKNMGKGEMFFAREGDILALCGFSHEDRATNQAKIWLHLKENKTDDIAKGDSVYEANSALNAKIISYLLFEGFYRRKFHKISIEAKKTDTSIIKVLDEYKWKREGVIADNYFENGNYVDGILFAMFAKDFYNHSIAMIPFLTGYLIIQATNDAVFGISIIKKDEEIPSVISDNIDFINLISKSDNKISEPENYDTIYVSDKAYPYLKSSAQQLMEYISGIRTQFDIEFEHSDATIFQKKVWDITKRIPFGQTCTYEDIAKQIHADDKDMNMQLLSRAVGTALSKNPIMIAIPCHRVIGKDGKLKGFAGGIEIKDFLLSHEMLFSNRKFKS